MYLVASLFISVPAFILSYKGVNNLPLLHLFTVVEFILLALFYNSILSESSRVYIKPILIVVAILLVLNSIFLQGVYEYNSIAKGISQIFILGLSIYYIFNSDKHQIRKDNSEVGFLNMINGAILFYFAGSLFIFMSTNFLISMTDALVKTTSG